MSHGQQPHQQPGDRPFPGEHEPAAESTMWIPPETPAEITTPLPAVPPSQPGQTYPQERVTAGLPILDLFDPQGSEPPQPPPTLLAGQYVPPPYQPAPAPPMARRPLRPDIKLVAAIGVGVLLLAVLGIWALSGPKSPSPPAAQTRSSTTPVTTSNSIRAVGEYQFTQQAARTDTDCAANAYGRVAEFFRGRPCTGLARGLYSCTVDGRLVVVAVATVRMPSEQAATELKALVDDNGTGNVNDLLRDGVRVPGGPELLTDAGYASIRDGTAVMIAEADFADRAARGGDLLDQISEAALQLRP